MTMKTFLSETVTLYSGDCLAVLPQLDDCSCDSVVCDPPYGLEFMGKDWDGADGFRRSLNESDAGRDSAFGRLSRRGPEYRADNVFQEWCGAWSKECLRVLKPGGHLLAFSSTRTYHRMASAIDDAGFEIRDQIGWVYGSGFPKSLNLDGGWAGWGTALKPAWEPICVARKPLVGTVAKNVSEFGTGAINIDGCRVGVTKRVPGSLSTTPNSVYGAGLGSHAQTGSESGHNPNIGRWPANLVHDGSDEVLACFPQSDGQQARISGGETSVPAKGDVVYGFRNRVPVEMRGDTGSAARFFYCAKADAEDRIGAKHPTVKPIDLIQWLVRLVTPRGGIVLDCFAGTGTTGEAAWREGMRAILIEREPEYQADIARRMELAANPTKRTAVARTKNRLVDPNTLPLFSGDAQ